MGLDAYGELRDCGDKWRLLLDDEHVRRDGAYDHWGACDTRYHADERRDHQSTRDKHRNGDAHMGLHVNDHRDHLVSDGNEEMDSGGLIENRHATSGHSSDVPHHGVRHYGGDASALRDGGAGSRGYGGAGSHGGGDAVRRPCNDALYTQRDDALEHNKRAAACADGP